MTTHFHVFNAFILCCQCKLTTMATTVCATTFTKQILQIYNNVQQIKTFLHFSQPWKPMHYEVRQKKHSYDKYVTTRSKAALFCKIRSKLILNIIIPLMTQCPVFTWVVITAWFSASARTRCVQCKPSDTHNMPLVTACFLTDFLYSHPSCSCTTFLLCSPNQLKQHLVIYQ